MHCPFVLWYEDRMRSRVTFPILTAALLGCGEPRAAIEMRFDGEVVYECDDANLSELSPKPGGWAFQCGDGSSVYVVYETDDTPAKGTIESITIRPKEGATQTPTDLHALADEPGIDCPSAKPDRGPDAFPTTTRGPKPGTYTLALVRPCGALEVVIR
jgi:hypothetical protein